MKFQYIGYELLRLWRNKPFFFFSLIFPIALFAVFALTMGESKIPIGTHDIPVIIYYMASMAGYGALMAALSGGARISTERVSEWDRQLHLTPLSSSQYMFAKVVTAYLMSALSMLLIYLTGVLLGARVEGVGRWVVMSGLILVGVLPFAILGIALGLILSTDAMGPALGGAGAFFGFLGGRWFHSLREASWIISGSCFRPIGLRRPRCRRCLMFNGLSWRGWSLLAGSWA